MDSSLWLPTFRGGKERTWVRVSAQKVLMSIKGEQAKRRRRPRFAEFRSRLGNPCCRLVALPLPRVARSPSLPPGVPAVEGEWTGRACQKKLAEGKNLQSMLESVRSTGSALQRKRGEKATSHNRITSHHGLAISAP